MQIFIGVAQPLKHALLVRREIRNHAMEEKRRFVEKPLRQLDPLHDHAASNRMQLGVFLGRQLASGEHDHRNLRQRVILPNMLKQLEPRHIRQLEIENDAIGWLLPKHRQSLAAIVGGDDFDVLVAEQLGYAQKLGRIVLNDEQPLA